MEDFLRTIGNFGFPMVVSVYLLIRLEAKLERIAQTVSELAEAVRHLERGGESDGYSTHGAA